MNARILYIFSLISAPLLVTGQPSQIAGPVSGYVFDGSAKGLRPILGMPGASLLGDSVNFGFAVGSVSVAPRQDAAFVTAADGSFHLFRIQAGAPAETVVNGLSVAPDAVVFSPSGTAAAIEVNGSIQIVSGLPDSPAIAATIDAQAFGAPAAMALSDDGAALLLATANSIELFSGAADQGKLAVTTGQALVAFAPSGHDAAIFDRGGAGLVLYRGLTAAAASQPVAPVDDSIRSAAALAFSTDGQRLLLASPGTQSVLAFDLAGGTHTAVACSCLPLTLARMGDVFRLNEVGGGPLWLLDARTDTATLTFVPADASAPVSRRPEGPAGPRRGSAPLEETAPPAARIQAARSE